jgi:peptidoglycan hydrolase-like protein with peptidoglycan-binding domain
MVKMKKYWLPIALGLVGIFYIIRSLKKTDSVMDNNGNVDTSVPDSTFPLKKGSKGELVKKLQLALGADKLPKYGIDGDFGNETLNALKAATGKTQVDSQAEIDAIAKKK